MKLAKCNQLIVAPTSWNDISYGTHYRETLEKVLKAWWPKIFGFYLLKIGSLSSDLDTSDCAISHQVSVGIEGKCFQVIGDPYQLPFINRSIDACLLAHTLSYAENPLQLLREANRVLIDKGWLIITTFNPISILGLGRICPIFFHHQPYGSRMYTQIRLLDWLRVLGFAILYRTSLQILPWYDFSKNIKLPRTYFSAIGCLNVIIAQKQIFPLSLIPIKKSKTFRSLCRPINAATLAANKNVL